MTEKYIGLCKMAGGILVGSDSIIDGVRRGKVRFVLISRDASERTKKQIKDKCTFYKVKYFISEYGGDEAARIIGKSSPCAAMAFTGKGPWKQVLDCLSPEPASDGNKVLHDRNCNDRKDD